MEMVSLTMENIGTEHICCAISGEKDPQVLCKKAWLSDRLSEGLVFLKSPQRGKCFIEYLPAEQAWVPIDAAGYMHINCLWVSGKLKGQGNGGALLDECIRDSRQKGRLGLCVISSPKKMPFLSDPQFLSHKGFTVADTADPFFTLMYLPFDHDAPLPRFRACAKHPQIEEQCYVLYYTHGCPYTAKYVPILCDTARAQGIPMKAVLIDSREKAQRAPAAWTNYALFHNGAYVTNEILSDKKFLKIAAEDGYEVT